MTRFRISILVLTCLALARTASAADTDMTFTLLNKTYTDLVGEVEPIVQGPLTIRPSSPKNALTLRDNRLHLHPEGTLSSEAGSLGPVPDPRRSG